MIKESESQPQEKKALGIQGRLGDIIREINSLWHGELLQRDKKPGWGLEFDEKSDALLGQAGEILSSEEFSDEQLYRFAIAYGRLSMGVPYIAYHTVDAIILTFGV